MISRTIVFCDRDWGQGNQMLCTELADWMLGENDAPKNFQATNSFYPRILLMARLTSCVILYSLAAAVKHLAHLGWQVPCALTSHACLAPTAKQGCSW